MEKDDLLPRAAPPTDPPDRRICPPSSLRTPPHRSEEALRPRHPPIEHGSRAGESIKSNSFKSNSSGYEGGGVEHSYGYLWG